MNLDLGSAKGKPHLRWLANETAKIVNCKLTRTKFKGCMGTNIKNTQWIINGFWFRDENKNRNS